MERKENQRVMLTKRLVREALIGLLETKSIERISIRELCAQAGINRSTFYAHYGSQADVLADIASHYLADISRVIAAADIRDQSDVIQRVTTVLEYMQSHIQLSRMLLGNYADKSFAVRLISLPQIQEMLSGALAGTEEVEKQDCIVFTVNGSYRLIEEWINAEDRVLPQIEARNILTLARRVCARG